MESQSLLMIALVVAVGAIAYLLGQRRRPEDAAPPGPAATPEKAPEQPKKPAPRPKAASEPALAKVQYEEDEEIDPTKIGAHAGVAAPKVVYQPPVQKIVYDEDAATEEPTRAESLFLLSATAQTDKGLRRKRNEDSVLVLDAKGLFVVADGMGGYSGGDLASQLAVKTIGDAFRTGNFDGTPHEDTPRGATELARAIQMANAAIREQASTSRELEGMGTTVCAAQFSTNKRRLYVGHVGDSRCYRMRAGVFVQMTRDHTMADHGVKGPEAQHLSRAVGIWPTVPIDVLLAVPEPGDVYLLCSDGLTKMLDNEAIAKVVREESEPKAAVERLIQEANARGGKDNITVVLVRVAPTTPS